MFLARTFFWLGSVVALLPPSAEGEPPPRVSLFNAAVAARAIIADLGSVCERNPQACDTSGQAIRLVGLKLATGAEIVSAGVSATTSSSSEPPAAANGSLKPDDLQPGWTAPSS